MSSEDKLLEAIVDFASALEAACVQLKQHIGERVGVKIGVKEESFNVLKFEKQTGLRIGEFEVATKQNNLPDVWDHAYNILKQNSVTIKNRYHGPGYAYSYWLYGEDRIYRQKLKNQA